MKLGEPMFSNCFPKNYASLQRPPLDEVKKGIKAFKK